MTETELNKYRSALEAKKAELEQTIRNREAVDIERCPDAVDESIGAAERELAIRSLNRATTLIHEVEAAISRIEKGGFGVCFLCEDPIESNRLNAVPWTTACIGCADGCTIFA